MAVPQVLRIVGPPFWGWLADRGGSRVLLLRVSSVGAFLAALLLPLAGGASRRCCRCWRCCSS